MTNIFIVRACLPAGRQVESFSCHSERSEESYSEYGGNNISNKTDPSLTLKMTDVGNVLF